MKPRANIQIYNEDCLPAMRQMKDNEFDLAIVDPPYGIGESNKDFSSRSKLADANKYQPKEWDKEPPSPEYFKELFRVSKNQIIWGANHFLGKTSPAWVVWDKDNGMNDYADCELAWTSFNKAVRKFKYRWNGMLQEDMRNKEHRIHPTQKPVALYKWLLKNYAKTGDRILDTHLGSGSIAIVCWDMGFDLVGYEIDKDYYEAAMKRFKNHTAQLQLDLAV